MIYKKSCIVISASSDIGYALSKHWLDKEIDIYGTYRTFSPKVEELKKNDNVKLFECDLLDDFSIDKACQNLKNFCPKWDILVFSAGVLDPIGPFENVDFRDWQNGIKVNFLSCMNILHQLLSNRNLSGNKRPIVLFFAGGGTNNAPKEYSSYTLSKISLIKSCELLDAEIPDTNFVIVGPGWVKTKIHDSILKKKTGMPYQVTNKRYEDNNFIPMENVLYCFDWLINTDSKGISGRNFSVSSDMFGSKSLEKELENDQSMYKLRRYKNDWKN